MKEAFKEMDETNMHRDFDDEVPEIAVDMLLGQESPTGDDYQKLPGFPEDSASWTASDSHD
ncbi:hypothetical protein PV11_00737 [Exophiala sideris]|uniref:Uncharacterized protein n=1 Tax=Exophiala sideris TaxID=1016849 RepID=A0A0D1XAU7_9EURO|nr:hypothetical protein PV11_00737 [Exophiala sideris]